MTNQTDWLTDRFEENRPHLQSVAYRMLGSLTEAEDAVQETWIRVTRAGTEQVENLGGWLTTIVARVCLNMLRARNVRREQSISTELPDPVVTGGAVLPDEEAVLADSIGLALLVVLDNLAPAERLVFVLHDMFQLPFEEIAPLVGRSPAAARQLASRARRRVQGAEVRGAVPDPGRQRQIVDAFLQAARQGDFETLVSLLHPDVVLRIDSGDFRPVNSMVLRGADAVVAQSRRGLKTWLSRPTTEIRPVRVAGAIGVIVVDHRELTTVMGFTFSGDRIIEIDAIANPERVARLLAAGAPD